MDRRQGLFAAAAVALLAAPCGLAAQPNATGANAPVMQVARLAHGSLHGVVSDERGDALEGATVSAIGEAMVFAVTDRMGRFNFESLPAGPYLLRAHRPGFAAARREYVDIRPSTRAVRWIELRRLAVGTIGSNDPEILAAGVMMTPTAGSDAVAPESSTGENSADGEHPHSELAWRLRHARRSVLKDDAATVAAIDDAAASDTTANFSSGGSGFASLFGNLPFSGEINLLTAGSYDTPADLFGSGLPRGVTYVSIGPAGDLNGGWAVQAALSQGDVSSWVVAGSYAPRAPRTHTLDIGLSYSSQQYVGGNPAALAEKSDGSRHVGNIRAFDNWTVSPRVHLTYGTRLGRYDYVDRDVLWSPSVAVQVDLTPKTHMRTEVTQSMRAPGSEEFLLPSSTGLWLPPQRTFSMLHNDDYRVERARRVAVSVARDVGNDYVIAIRRFFERTDDQLVTIFGAGSIGGVRSDVGHYLLATAGAFDADGWGVSLSSPIVSRIRGSVDYQLTHAHWAAAEPMALAVVAPSAVRAEPEDVHDVATSVEAVISETGTRVFFFYRISNAFARDDAFQLVPGLGGRFELQVKQGLGFMPFRGSEWQVLVGVRDMFGDPTIGASLYDELLVVRPPKQVVGGVQVKF